MAGLIPKSFIDDVLARTDIVELIDRYVPLKRAGANMVACCPFHNEKSPSFTVSPNKQFYHCFGCGAHGSSISFLMEYERMEFPEAVETLAHHLGLEVPEESGKAPDKNSQNNYESLKKAADFFRTQLKMHSPAIEYLKDRSISGKTVANFGIGYAPAEWDGLIKAIARSNTDLQALLDTGMIIKKDNKQYDRFRDRIMFPIHDHRGRVIGFGGRVIDNSQTPKYLNSPETPVFHKGYELYGLYEARKLNTKLQQLLVVEGYMDVVALAEHGIYNAVATLGTATTPEHIQKLFKSCQEIIFCFDGDQAGKQAAWRALENTLSVFRDGYQIKFLFLPDGEDPDTLVKKVGKEKFQQAISNATSLTDYLFNHLCKEIDIDTLEGKARLVEKAKPLLEKVKGSVFFQLLSAHLAQITGISEEKLGLPEAINTRRKPLQKTASQKTSLENNAIRFAVAAILDQPQLALEHISCISALKHSDQAGVNLLVDLLITVLHNTHIDSAALLRHYLGTEHEKSILKLAAYEFTLNPEQEHSLALQLSDAMQQLLRRAAEYRYSLLISKPLSELSAEEKQELRKFSR